jgi:hypothetical protein
MTEVSLRDAGVSKLRIHIYSELSQTTSRRQEDFHSLPLYWPCHSTGKLFQYHEATFTHPIHPGNTTAKYCASIAFSSSQYGSLKYSL